MDLSARLHRLIEAHQPLFTAWRAHGVELYLVGGCIRDLYMNRDGGDVDMTTNAHPDLTMEILESMGMPAYPIGKEFGTITTQFQDKFIEITTFRVEEHYEHGNRKPEVIFGDDLTIDLSRRDLSMNAMALNADGQLFDPFRGVEAIAQQILEVPGGGLAHTKSILEDDPLRLLRIGRFCARFGFQPTADTTQAAQLTAPQLRHISHERWTIELDKILLSPHMVAGCNWLNHVGALDILFPALEADTARTRALFEQIASMPCDRVARWAALFLAIAWIEKKHRLPDLRLPAEERLAPEISGKIASRLARNFRFSNEQRAAMSQLCTSTLDADALNEPWDRRKQRRFLAKWGNLYAAALEVAHAWTWSVVADFPNIRATLDQAAVSEDVEVRLPRGFGHSVLNELKIPRGPQVAQAINTVRDAIVDGAVPNGADASVYLAFLRAQDGKMDS